MRIALLGTGFIADFHARALAQIPGVKLDAVCDADPAKAQNFARRWGVPVTYTSLEKMLRKNEPDAVHILLPPAMHAAAAVACLEAGTEVLIEKPMAASSAECREILAAAEHSGRVAAVNHNAVFHPAFQRALDRIRRREIGGVEHVSCCLNVPLRQLSQGQHGHWMFQEPGNIILEQATHPLSQIELLIGAPRSVSVLTTAPSLLSTGKPFHATWQAAMDCERGTAQCLFSFGAEHLEHTIHIVGQDGSLFVDLRRNVVSQTGKTRFMEPVDDLLQTSRNARRLFGRAITNFAGYALSFLGLGGLSSPFPMSMQGSLEAFYRALRSGEPFAGGGDRGLAVVQVCEAISRAREDSIANVREFEAQPC